MVPRPSDDTSNRGTAIGLSLVRIVRFVFARCISYVNAIRLERKLLILIIALSRSWANCVEKDDGKDSARTPKHCMWMDGYIIYLYLYMNVLSKLL